MNTQEGAYCLLPHKTIEELRDIAQARVAHGEPAWWVIQDLVNGYSLGWDSANHRSIAFGLQLPAKETAQEQEVPA